jgi:hypothetical protein
VDVSVTEPPAQKTVGPLAEILATGNALTVTGVTAEVALHPLASITFTEGLAELVTRMVLVV